MTSHLPGDGDPTPETIRFKILYIVRYLSVFDGRECVATELCNDALKKK